ncbi:putative Brain tumor protein [Hypsibius exemplaris]|uniref:Brain tumor protein n=1 Tax=Hypsibius exemplaris TaxID=2072580 RepID=A0A1W0WTS9_HYPEX|nr:putative Brain tumor protein [Hypsibius exemplaris]
MDSATSSGLRCSNGHATVDYSNARVPRRQTLPSIFPIAAAGKDMEVPDRLQGPLDRIQDLGRCLSLLENNYALTKKQVDERKAALVDALEKQFAALYTQLEGSYEGKKQYLTSLLRSEQTARENSGDSAQNGSGSNSTLFSSHNGGTLSEGNKQNGYRGNGVGRDDLFAACVFDVMDDPRMQEIPDFTEYLRSRLSGGPRQKMAFDKSIDLTGKGYNRPVSDFSSAWSYSGEDQRCSGLSDSFSAFDFPPKSSGTNSSFQSYSSSGQYNQESFTSSAVFTPDSAPPMSPFSSGNRSFNYDSRQQGRILPLQNPPPSSGDFFSSPPRGLPGVPEYNSIDHDEEMKMQELRRRPGITADVLNNLVQQHHFNLRNGGMSSGQSRVGPTNPFGMSSGIRRSNSNKNRSKGPRRYSLPDASRIQNSSWSGNSSGPHPGRSGSFLGSPADSLNENDDAFLPDNHRQGNGMQELEILCRFGEIGSGAGQMNAPHGFCLGDQEEVIVADTNNHRIQFFSSDGQCIDSWGKPGKREGQLWFPRKVAWLPESARVVVCDRGHERSRVQIFSRNGLYERTIPMDYVAIVAGMTVYRNQIVIVDSVNPTCLIMDQFGTVVFWFSCAKNMKEPSDVAVANNTFYICDFKGHCVCTYNGRGEFVTQIGSHPTINFPNGIDITAQGDVLVGDSHGNRFHVAAYRSDGVFLAEYECPHMKVSRCCGLVLTEAGHVVTVAKNNNFVLILERLSTTVEGHDALPELSTRTLEETEF